MTTIPTQTPQTPEPTAREAFVAGLRRLADTFEQNEALPVPTITTSVPLMTLYGEKGREAFLAARAAFPDATPELSNYWVEILIAPGILLTFSKDALCTKRTESRDVEVYDIDPELLQPIVSKHEQDRRDAAEDMRMDAQAEAHAEAQALGYCDDDCRAEIETDAMLDEVGR